MSVIYTSVDQLIGHTPLLELSHLEKESNSLEEVFLQMTEGGTSL